MAIAAFNRPFGTERSEGFDSDLGGPSLLAPGDVRWATVFGTDYDFFTILIDDTGEREGTLVLQSRTLNGIPISDAREMATLGSGASILRHHAADGTLMASPHALVTVAPDGPAGSVP